MLLSFSPHSPAGLFKGPRGKGNVLGASQLGLVYFPLLSNKRHFLVLMAWKESVIKIQPRGVTKHKTEPQSSTKALHCVQVEHCYETL